MCVLFLFERLSKQETVLFDSKRAKQNPHLSRVSLSICFNYILFHFLLSLSPFFSRLILVYFFFLFFSRQTLIFQIPRTLSTCIYAVVYFPLLYVFLIPEEKKTFIFYPVFFRQIASYFPFAIYAVWC